ncbi:TetR/AcrR family transcriptional regulator [Microlunatus speluncae]|uniref:TetR/AcrR family transcriptional regulator n=1 Tax=Microlunatus speluncae TaxID=2594267 RepID=UPI00126641E2|nr:TetR family transcriptional regulator [Microlunatus speluncae]
MKKSSPRAATRPGLSAREILSRAVIIADREGIDAVSMRRLARELSVTPMALYWHFDDKDQLLEAMAEQVVVEAEFADSPGQAWEERYRGALTALVRLLRAHPWMGRMVIERIVPLPNYLAALEIMLDCGRLAGLDLRLSAYLAQQAVQAVAVLAEYEPRHDPAATADAGDHLAAFRTAVDPDRFPNVYGALEPLTTPQDVDEYYRLGIDLIIGGIRSVAAQPR